MNMFRLSLATLLIVSATAQAADTLPPGFCPFDAALIKKNFTAAIRRDYGDEFIREAFARRERWYGACAKAEAIGRDRWKLSYADAEVPVELERRAGKIEQFEFFYASIPNDSREKFKAFFAKNYPLGSFYFGEAGEAAGAVSFRGDELLAVGEGSNLLLASALEQKIAGGALNDKAKVALTQNDRVKETDDLADEKNGAALTVAELKERIFTRRDRTAADMVLRVVGAEALEQDRPKAAPFLSNREAAWLMGISPAKMQSLKRETAREVAASLNQAAEYPPFIAERYDHLEKVGWFASTAELCAATKGLAQVPEISGGLASQGFRQQHPRWKSLVYHAAREFGLAQTTWSAIASGAKRPICFSLTVNEARAVDESQILEMEDRAAKLFQSPGR